MQDELSQNCKIENNSSILNKFYDIINKEKYSGNNQLFDYYFLFISNLLYYFMTMLK